MEYINECSTILSVFIYFSYYLIQHFHASKILLNRKNRLKSIDAKYMKQLFIQEICSYVQLEHFSRIIFNSL